MPMAPPPVPRWTYKADRVVVQPGKEVTLALPDTDGVHLGDTVVLVRADLTRATYRVTGRAPAASPENLVATYASWLALPGERYIGQRDETWLEWIMALPAEARVWWALLTNVAKKTGKR